MRIMNLCSMLLLAGAATLTTATSEGQIAASPKTQSPTLNVGLMYSANRSNAVGGNNFWGQGGTLEFSADVFHGLGIAFNASSSTATNINTAGADLTTITMTVGPRYTWTPRSRRFDVFGEGLVGDARGTHSLFPTSTGVVTDIDALAIQVGGGVDLRASRRLSVRALQADWVRTQFPNGTTNVQNTLRLGAGLIFRLR